MKLSVDAARVQADLDRLATFSDDPAPAVTRILFTEVELSARKFLVKLFEEAGLTVRRDAVGNLFARWPGSDPSLPAVATGSHADALPLAGMYDGTVGVVGPIEAVRALRRAGLQPRRSIDVIMFTSEEPTRFGLGCLGSRLLSGKLDAAKADAMKDERGLALLQVRRNAGCDGDLASVRLPKNCYAGFVELHIEQGPLLEREGLDVGVVTAIAAPAALRVRYTGPGGHAGAVLMADRADPLQAGARLAVEVEAAALEEGGPDTVATVGILDVSPRAVNSIPREVYMEIDVRDVDGSRRDRVLERIRRSAERFGSERRTPTTVELINADPPAICDPHVVEAISAAADEAGCSQRRMVSRAYHDSLFMSLVCPTSMIFIPCRDGVSHRPDEFASTAAIGRGVEVLARTLAKLSQ
jgi:N-carbamoyl-L-amino-acid hydrolase